MALLGVHIGVALCLCGGSSEVLISLGHLAFTTHHCRSMLSIVSSV